MEKRKYYHSKTPKISQGCLKLAFQCPKLTTTSINWEKNRTIIILWISHFPTSGFTLHDRELLAKGAIRKWNPVWVIPGMEVSSISLHHCCTLLRHRLSSSPLPSSSSWVILLWSNEVSKFLPEGEGSTKKKLFIFRNNSLIIPLCEILGAIV